LAREAEHFEHFNGELHRCALRRGFLSPAQCSSCRSGEQYVVPSAPAWERCGLLLNGAKYVVWAPRLFVMLHLVRLAPCRRTPSSGPP